MRFREPGFRLAMAALAAAALIAVIFIDRPLSELMRGLDPQIHAVAEHVTWFGRSTSYLVGLAIVFAGLLLTARFVDLAAERRAALRRWAAMAAFVWLSVALPGLANDVVKLLVGRARPTVEAGGLAPVTFGYAYQSFPSGHTAVAFGLAFAVGMLWPRWRWAMLLFAVAVGASRIMLRAHYLGDVIGGALIALIVVELLAGLFARRGLLFKQP
jgi:membrane-associated phospholipid phosphatase